MISHLHRCQGLAVKYYGLTSAELSRCPPLDALDLGHPRLLQQQGKVVLILSGKTNASASCQGR